MNLQVPRLIDTHVHLDDHRFDNDRDQVVARAQSAGVNAIVIPAVSANSWGKLKKVSECYSNIFPTIGLHPLYSHEHRQHDLTRLELALTNKQFVAIGECGLDGATRDIPMPLQHEYFVAQLDLAKQYDLPVIIHAHRATEAVILALRKHGPERGVVHSYNGSMQQAHRLIDLGYCLGFGGPATYPGSRKIHQLVQKLPLENMMLETDAPFQPVHNQINNRNEPANATKVLSAIAALRGQTINTIAIASNHNAIRLFSLPLPTQTAESHN